MTRRDAVFPENRQALYEAHGYSAAIRSGERQERLAVRCQRDGSRGAMEEEAYAEFLFQYRQTAADHHGGQACQSSSCREAAG